MIENRLTKVITLQYHFIRAVCRALFKVLLTRKKVFGLENIPASEPYLVLINHISHLDLLMILAVAPVRSVRFLISERWVKYMFIGPILRWLGAIPVSFVPGAQNYSAIRNGLRALKGKQILCLAPEATINPSGLLKGNKGAGWFASQADIPILCVGITNTDRVMANAKRLRSTTVEVRIGRPFKLPKSGQVAGKNKLENYRHLIMSHIAALTPPRYHGYYADSPVLAAIIAQEDPWLVAQELDDPVLMNEIDL